jgi:hypothetical protein
MPHHLISSQEPGPHPLCYGLPHQDEPSALRLRSDMRQAEEVEGLRLSQTLRRPARWHKAAKLYQSVISGCSIKQTSPAAPAVHLPVSRRPEHVGSQFRSLRQGPLLLVGAVYVPDAGTARWTAISQGEVGHSCREHKHFTTVLSVPPRAKALIIIG